MTLGITTLRIIILSIKTLSITTLLATFSHGLIFVGKTIVL